MEKVFIQSSAFILIICLGFFLKTIGLLKQSDSQILGRIIMNVTLPCVFLASAGNLALNMTFMIYCLFGLFTNILTLAASYMLTQKKTPLMRGTYMIACSGYDVGNFVLPFVSVLFPEALVYLVSFNISNTMMSLGGNYACAAMASGQSQPSLKTFIKELFSSVSFDVYCLLVILAALHLKLPHMINYYASVIAQANSFLVMLMIGLKLELHFSHNAFNDMIKILLIRLSGAIMLTLIILLMPIDQNARTILIMACFGPLVSVSSIYAERLSHQGELVAQCTTLSIIMSLILIPLIAVIF